MNHDRYFKERIHEERINLEDRIDSLNSGIPNLTATQFIDITKEVMRADGNLRLGEHEASHDGIIDDGVEVIIASVLSKYHAHGEVVLKNQDFERAAKTARHYRQLSIQAHYDGQIFNAKDYHNWKLVKPKKGESLFLYAHDPEGRQKKARSAIDNLTRHLGNPVAEQDPYSNFVHREVSVLNSGGLHMRPAAQIVKAVSDFPGKVVIKYNGSIRDPRSVMSLISMAAKKGTLINFYYEPDVADTQDVHKKIEYAVSPHSD